VPNDQVVFNKTFSTIVIGSSPICLLHSLHLSSKGQDVLVLEAKGVLGGAWATVSNGRFERIEFGAHLIANYERLLKVFSKKYNIAFERLKHQPIAHLNNRFYKNTDWLWFKHDFKEVLKSIARLNPYYFLLQLRNLVKYYSKTVYLNLIYNHFKRTDYTYMKNGCHELIGSLVSQNFASGTKIQLEFPVLELKIDAQRKLVTVSNLNSVVEGKKVIIPRNTFFNKVTLGNSVYEPKALELNFRTIFIEIKSDSNIKLSYLHLFDHKVFSRVSNITDTVLRNPLSDKHHLFSAQMKGGSMEVITLSEAINVLFKFLLENSLIGSDSEVTDRFEYTFKRTVFEDRKFLRKIRKQSKGLVDILDSRTFSDSINAYFKYLFR
jgi:hypothetical protein